MAPFPETEVMTIKRIEVALRKMDFKLLKDGAYKLHEKFHSGYKFEFLDVLSEIRTTVQESAEIPIDIKDILIPTIDDILEKQEVSVPSSGSQERVSSLTSLHYNPIQAQENAQEEIKKEEEPQQIDAFAVFGAKKTETSGFNNTQYSSEPFKEFTSPVPSYLPQQQANNTEASLNNSNQNNENKEQQTKQEENIQNEPTEVATENKTKTISVFYNQDYSYEKDKNINRYRELIKKDENQINLFECLNLIKEINVQSNTNVSELKSILEQLNLKEHKVNLITNSSSANLVQLLQISNIKYSLIDKKEDAKLTLLPLLGLTNLFRCQNCNEEILNDSSILTSMILECPKCKSPMFPNFYTSKDEICEIDMKCYRTSLVSLANSDTWLIINPNLDDKLSYYLLKNALEVNANVKEIYIVHKDINIRESFKNMFLEIRNSLNVNTQISVIEDFLNSLGN